MIFFLKLEVKNKVIMLLYVENIKLSALMRCIFKSDFFYRILKSTEGKKRPLLTQHPINTRPTVDATDI